MYRPLQPGIPRALKHRILYEEFLPQIDLRDMVYCFWRLQTRSPLEKDFQYLVLPDGCLDIIFDASVQPSTDGAFIMTPATVAERINLGKDFLYIGVRLQPGVWLSSPADIVGSSIQFDSLGKQDVRRVREQLVAGSKDDQARVLNQLVAGLVSDGIVERNLMARAMMQVPDLTVERATMLLGYSRRQVQRLLWKHIGYRPRDFIKVLRFQWSLRSGLHDNYADQSHQIREFRRITGMTPQKFRDEYTMSDSSNTTERQKE